MQIAKRAVPMLLTGRVRGEFRKDDCRPHVGGCLRGERQLEQQQLVIWHTLVRMGNRVYYGFRTAHVLPGCSTKPPGFGSAE